MSIEFLMISVGRLDVLLTSFLLSKGLYQKTGTVSNIKALNVYTLNTMYQVLLSSYQIIRESQNFKMFSRIMIPRSILPQILTKYRPILWGFPVPTSFYFTFCYTAKYFGALIAARTTH